MKHRLIIDFFNEMFNYFEDKIMLTDDLHCRIISFPSSSIIFTKPVIIISHLESLVGNERLTVR